jgi:AcrR family transcriptional regulator
MPRPKLEVIAEYRCGEILEAARKVFARRGFAETTVDEIAEAAGISKGTFYAYFPSKHKVYVEALRQGLHGLIEESQQRMEQGHTAAEKIRIFIDTRIGFFERNRDFFRIYHFEFNNLLMHPAQLSPEGFKELYIRQASRLDQVLRDGIASGEVRPLRTENVAYTIYDMARGVVTQRMMGWSTVSVEQEVDQLFALIWRGIAAHPGD